MSENQANSYSIKEKSKRRHSLSTGLSIMVVCMILVTSVLVGALAYVAYRTDTIEMHSERCLSIALSVAAAIDPDGLEQALSTRDKDAQWDGIKEFVDKVAVENDLEYLYVTGSDHSSGFYTYYVEGYNPKTGDPPLDFLYEEAEEIYDDEADEAIRTGKGTLTEIYDSSGEGFDYGMLVTGYAPITKSDGTVVGLVGVDVSMETALAHVYAFMLRTILITAVSIIVFTLIAASFINRRVKKPVNLVSVAAENIAMGVIDYDVTYDRNDEIGALFTSFNKMTDSLREQVTAFKRIAEGDLTVEITPRSDQDELSFAMQTMADNLRQMLDLFKKSAESLNTFASSIAEESALVSKDTNSEIDAANGIGEAVTAIMSNTQENADTAQNANELIMEMDEMARQGSVLIERMIDSVAAIQLSYSSITKVVDSIDAIAFQTNILALNAAVEAARAGQVGKGFSVVADEVGSLATKSSTSARSADELISDALQQVSTGSEVAAQAAAAFEEIVKKIEESGVLLSKIAAASTQQSDSIVRINSDIGLMNDMIRRTASSAESSAAVADELTVRAKQLSVMLERFVL